MSEAPNPPPPFREREDWPLITRPTPPPPPPPVPSVFHSSEENYLRMLISRGYKLMPEEILDKAPYPRCATCKHYRPFASPAFGVCLRIKKTDMRAPAGTASLDADEYGHAELFISEDFGCVLHEEK